MNWRLLLVAILFLPFTFSYAVSPVNISILQPYPAYGGVQIVNNSDVNMQITFDLKGNDNAVNLTLPDDPNFPTTCQATLATNNSCTIWLHSVNNLGVGVMQEGHLDVQVSYNHTVVNATSINLANESDLYAGGDFSQATNPDGTQISANHIAKWNGTVWSTLGSGVDMSSSLSGQVRALTTTTNGLVYAGGWFNQAGGNTANNIAQWNEQTQQWSALYAGIAGQVNALVTGVDGLIYAGGSFTAYLGNNITKWDPKLQQWFTLGKGVSGEGDSSVYALTNGSDGSIYVGGGFTQAGTVLANGIAQWNIKTQQWTALGSGISGYRSSAVYALTIGADNSIYVGGLFSQVDGKPANAIAQWNPATQQWSELDEGVSGIVYALRLETDGLVYVGGGFTQVGSIPANYIAQWNPKTQQWTALGNGVGSGAIGVYALTVSGDGFVYLGGAFMFSVQGKSAYGIVKWDPVAQQWLNIGELSGLGGRVYALIIAPHLLMAT